MLDCYVAVASEADQPQRHSQTKKQISVKFRIFGKYLLEVCVQNNQERSERCAKKKKANTSM